MKITIRKIFHRASSNVVSGMFLLTLSGALDPAQAMERWCRVNLQSEDGSDFTLDYRLEFDGGYMIAPVSADVTSPRLRPTDNVQLYVRSINESGFNGLESYSLRYDLGRRRFASPTLGEPTLRRSGRYPNLSVSELVSVVVNGRTLLDPLTRKPFFMTSPYTVHMGANCWTDGYISH